MRSVELDRIGDLVFHEIGIKLPKAGRCPFGISAAEAEGEQVDN